MANDFCYHAIILGFYSYPLPWFQFRVSFISEEPAEDGEQEKNESKDRISWSSIP